MSEKTFTPLSQVDKDFINSLSSEDLKTFEVVVFTGFPKLVKSKKTGNLYTIYNGILKYKGHEVCNLTFYENTAKASGKKFLAGHGSVKNQTYERTQETKKSHDELFEKKEEIKFEDIPF